MMDKNIGLKYGKLTIAKKVFQQKNKKYMYLCFCECGNEKLARIDHIRSGAIFHCGCLHISNHETYEKWRGMIKRCYTEKDISYKNYGARGITVCEEWRKDFFVFENWAINNGYKKGLTIERINNDGNYEPSNCKWITIKQQQSNKRNNRVFCLKGRQYTLKQICEEYKINWSTLYNRLKRGWDINKSINTPIQKQMPSNKNI